MLVPQCQFSLHGRDLFRADGMDLAPGPGTKLPAVPTGRSQLKSRIRATAGVLED